MFKVQGLGFMFRVYGPLLLHVLSSLYPKVEKSQAPPKKITETLALTREFRSLSPNHAIPQTRAVNLNPLQALTPLTPNPETLNP